MQFVGWVPRLLTMERNYMPSLVCLDILKHNPMEILRPCPPEHTTNERILKALVFTR